MEVLQEKKGYNIREEYDARRDKKEVVLENFVMS